MKGKIYPYLCTDLKGPITEHIGAVFVGETAWRQISAENWTFSGWWVKWDAYN